MVSGKGGRRRANRGWFNYFLAAVVVIGPPVILGSQDVQQMPLMDVSIPSPAPGLGSRELSFVSCPVILLHSTAYQYVLYRLSDIFYIMALKGLGNILPFQWTLVTLLPS